MPVGADYTGIKGILVLFRNIRVWGIPWGPNLWTPLLGPYFVKLGSQGVPFDGTGLSLHTGESNCRNIVFLLKLQGFQDLFRAGWLNGARVEIVFSK
jgi:hypothetical protein